MNVIVLDKKKICATTNWIFDKVVSCEGKRAIDLEEIPGYRTIHKFKLQGKKMIATEDVSESFELQLMK